MIDMDLLKNILIVAMSSSVVTTALVQKIKESLSSKKYITLISFGISLIVGTLFSKSFSNMNWIYSIWSGIFAFVGADALYQTFETKIFKRFSDIEHITEIKRDMEEE